MSSLFAVLWERRNEMEKKKPMQLYRKLFWTYSGVLYIRFQKAGAADK